jgi:N-acetylneuraminic acid mutarotase
VCVGIEKARHLQQFSDKEVFRLSEASTNSSMNNKRSTESAFLHLRALIALVLCIGTVGTLLGFLRPEAPTNNSQRTLTFAERVAYQRAIEDVYWRHRIWPKENLNPKPSLDAVMSQAQMRKKVADYLRESAELQNYWQRPITAEDLQAEMDRMAENTKQPDVLRKLFAALGNDSFVITECLARPLLSERLITTFGQEQRKCDLALSEVGGNNQTRKEILAGVNYALPTISDATTGCTPDTWTATSTANALSQRSGHRAVWTGSEMIVWGGAGNSNYLNTGGIYNPSTDSWTRTSTTNAPSGRVQHTAVWTGIEMIIWGGWNGTEGLNTGGRYNPSTDTWTATSTTNAPEARYWHTAVWTGSEMICWGGGYPVVNTGGRYNPSTDNWMATSTVNVPDARFDHTAIWTDSEMVVWGGRGSSDLLNTGGRYNPSTDSWTRTSTTNAPGPRADYTAVWTGIEMIVWGGIVLGDFGDTGGRYNPATNTWTATSISNVPEGRVDHTAVWTGSEMIVWGGSPDLVNALNTGGRYNPNTDSWTATTTINAPDARESHTAVWTNSEMIVWGGANLVTNLNTGGRYCAQSGAPTPSPTPTATASATATVTATATPSPTPTPTPCTGRCTPTPRPRPTPALRP